MREGGANNPCSLYIARIWWRQAGVANIMNIPKAALEQDWYARKNERKQHQNKFVVGFTESQLPKMREGTNLRISHALN